MTCKGAANISLLMRTEPVAAASGVSAASVTGVVAPEAARFRDVYELAKPNLTFLVVVTAVLGYGLAVGDGGVQWSRLIMLIVGTTLTSAGACALNMFIERDIDALMPRTRKRPIPSGRVSAESALFFALMTLSWGFGALAAFCGPLPAFLSLLTAAIYAFVYTPLKRRGPISVWVGAVPGAIPPLIGWSAATGSIAEGGVSLFLVLFCWQFPHFIALAYMYREDYRRAGFRFLPPTDAQTGRQILLGCAALVVVSGLPYALGLVGWIYLVGVMAAGLWFLKVCLRAALGLTGKRARQAFLASILYLPVVLALLVLDRLIL